MSIFKQGRDNKMPASFQTTVAAAQSSGWTLSELMVSLALVAVLAAVALPGFQVQQRQARRSDAQSALQQLQLAQARWRGTQSSHATDLVSLGWASNLSPGGHYRLAIEDANSEGYILIATPIGAQARDSACAPMRLHLRHIATVVLSSGTDLAGDPGRCWRQ
jgi:type IV pilus assembly protein PilE